MAKKKGGANMSAEIRKILEKKPDASNKDVFASLESKFGKGSFNEASCGVAVSNQRKKMGLSKSRSVKKRKPGRPAGRPATTGVAVDIDALKAAKALLGAVNGNESAAVSAIRQLSSLQIG